MAESKKTPERVQRILECFGKGYTAKLTCKMCGINETTLYEWMNSDAEFSESVQRAKGEAESRIYDRLTQIAELPAITDDMTPRQLCEVKPLLDTISKTAQWLLAHRHADSYAERTIQAQETESPFEAWLRMQGDEDGSETEEQAEPGMEPECEGETE